jgi:hypothetical protein
VFFSTKGKKSLGMPPPFQQLLNK